MVNPVSTAAIGFGFSAVGWLISPVLSRLLNQCFDALGIDLPPQFQSRKTTLLEKLKKLRTTLLPQLLILTDAAQQSPHQTDLEKWIQKLKSAFYETEHVLGLVEYERLQMKVDSLFPSFTSDDLLKQIKEKIQKLSPQQDNNNLIESLKNMEKNIEEESLPKHSSDKEKLIKSIENLEEIVNEAMEFVSLLNLPSSSVNNSTSSPYRVTISTAGSMVIGRDEDRNDIVKLLRENFSESTSNTPCYSVIGIWGMGGSGKTTLAQYVFDYEKEAKYFDRVIWAHVSQKFSVHAILKMIWESAFMEPCPNFSSLEGLQSKLGENLRGQMFFLVLDDVWCDKGVSEEELEQLFAPLKNGKRGSKILVTTRIEEAAKALGSINPIPLRELDEDQFFLLFMSNALGDVQISDHLNDKLTFIGKQIAAKLRRSPLAAKMVTGQLRRRLDTKFWSLMLNKSLLDDTMGVLFLSYQHLPSPLQRCFAFCSIFPKGHTFENDYLINIWIAEGFIETKHRNEHESFTEIEQSYEHVKDIANQYLQELISSSFFQVDKMYNDRYYYMHDLIHDLAQHVSQNECFRIGSGEKKKIPLHTRHLYVVEDMLEEYVEQICKLNDLCTIVVPGPFHVPNLKEVDLDALFKKLRKLYVVELTHIQSFPKSVIHLKNLRYLSIMDIKQEDAIPELITRLYQLRFLRIGKKYQSTVNRIEIPDVGRLILLQDLKKFHVRKKRGFELKQLEHLTNLFGSLSIYGLHNVERKEEAYQVKLSEKRGLHSLFLYWDHEREDLLRNNDVEILDGLCPPPQIKELFIQGFGGKQLPTWILENNDKLSGLESLSIYSLPRLKSWVDLPLNLTHFEISECQSLAFALKEDLEKITLEKSMQISEIVAFSNKCKCYYYLSSNCQFKRVQEMIELGDDIDEQALSTIANDLKGCLEKRLDVICKLKDIYGKLYLSPTLEDLSIESCFITDSVLAGSLRYCNFLTDLTLNDIITIMCITDEVLGSMTRLIFLKIQDCLLLRSIGGWDTHNTLEKLYIFGCPNLTLKASKTKATSSVLNYVSLQACMPSDDCFQNLIFPKRLNIWNCPNITNPHIGYLKSLIHLEFDFCPDLILLRGLSELNHLKELKMTGCQKFECYSDADKLTRLEELKINRFRQLEQLISKEGFSSLVSLELSDAEEQHFSQQECEVLCFLSFLDKICFNRCKMSILPNLLPLQALTVVDIYHCENLTSLSELPASVLRISIGRCNVDFTKSCRDPTSPNCQKISNIPKRELFD